MYIIGITGGIASGKTAVVSILKGLNFTIIEADVIARQVVERGGEAWGQLKEAFPSYFTKEGDLDRQALSHHIHQDDEARALINHITHPSILKGIGDTLAKYEEEDLPLIFVDVPLLFEVGLEDWFHEIWVVYVQERVQLNRLMARDSLSKEKAKDRISSQLPLCMKISLAHRIIYNMGQKEDLYQEVYSCLLGFLQEKGLHHLL